LFLIFLAHYSFPPPQIRSVSLSFPDPHSDSVGMAGVHQPQGTGPRFVSPNHENRFPGVMKQGAGGLDCCESHRPSRLYFPRKGRREEIGDTYRLIARGCGESRSILAPSRLRYIPQPASTPLSLRFVFYDRTGGGGKKIAMLLETPMGLAGRSYGNRG